MRQLNWRMTLAENRYPLFGIMRVEAVMTSRSSRLPSRFPVGTKFVIEGKRGGEGQVQVYSRYLEFPDGTFFRLPLHPAKREARPVDRCSARARRRRH